MTIETERNLIELTKIMSEMPIQLLHKRAEWLLRGANQAHLLTIEHDANEFAIVQKGVDNTSE
jgi:hypothetical protein